MLYAVSMEDKLVSWLSAQLNQRHLSIRELARRSEISHSWINNVLSGQSHPTWDFCAAIAKGLKVDPDQVFQLAGLRPSISPAVAQEREAVRIFRGLPANIRAIALSILRTLRGDVPYNVLPPPAHAVANGPDTPYSADNQRDPGLEALAELWDLAPDHIKPAIVNMVRDEVVLYLRQQPKWGAQAETGGEDDTAAGESL